MFHLSGNPYLILFWYDYFLFGCAQTLLKYVNCKKKKTKKKKKINNNIFDNLTMLFKLTKLTKQYLKKWNGSNKTPFRGKKN